jgi:hypothetical protein
MGGGIGWTPGEGKWRGEGNGRWGRKRNRGKKGYGKRKDGRIQPSWHLPMYVTVFNILSHGSNTENVQFLEAH